MKAERVRPPLILRLLVAPDFALSVLHFYICVKRIESGREIGHLNYTLVIYKVVR